MKQKFFEENFWEKKFFPGAHDCRRSVSNETLDKKGTGDEELANGVLRILDGWAANREASFMTAIWSSFLRGLPV